MNLKTKLKCLLIYLRNNPEYKPPSNLTNSLKYLSLALQIVDAKSYQAILIYSNQSGRTNGHYHKQNLDELSLYSSLARLLSLETINWKNEAFNKYWMPILEQHFDELSPIEQTKILTGGISSCTIN